MKTDSTLSNDRAIYFGLGIAVAMSVLSMFNTYNMKNLIHDDKLQTEAWAATVKAECGKYGINVESLRYE